MQASVAWREQGKLLHSLYVEAGRLISRALDDSKIQAKLRKKDTTKKRDAEKEQDLPPKKRPTTRSAPSSSM